MMKTSIHSDQQNFPQRLMVAEVLPFVESSITIKTAYQHYQTGVNQYAKQEYVQSQESFESAETLCATEEQDFKVSSSKELTLLASTQSRLSAAFFQQHKWQESYKAYQDAYGTIQKIST